MRLYTILTFALLASTPTLAASLTGTVSEAGGGVAVPGARVTVFSPDLTVFFEARTDGVGAWSLTGLPAGQFQLGVAKRDFEYVEIAVDTSFAQPPIATQLMPETHAGVWSIIGNTAPETFDATDIAFLMADGRIFLCHNTQDPVIFDPVTGTKLLLGPSTSEQGCYNGTVLDNGRLLFVGGQSPSSPGAFQNAIPWVKTWNPATSAWAQLANLQHAAGRWYPGLARLADGSLLVMGGGTAPSAQRTDTCERFDLTTESWSYTGSMLNPAEFPPSALLHTGDVLATWSPPQLYNVATGTWSATGNFVQPGRGWPGHSDHSIVVLSDGRVLAIGCRAQPNPVMAEIYDPVLGTWSLTSNSGLVRDQPEVVQLPDGRVFVAAGKASAPIPVPDLLGRVKWTDLYDPLTNSWRQVANMQIFREYHAVTVLVPDGRVVTTGGTVIDFVVGPTSTDVEAYEPPYLFRGVRPVIATLSTQDPTRGETVVMDIAPATQVTSVVLMGTMATTHWVDGGVPRRLELPVSQSGNQVSVAMPMDENVLPRGWYILFAMVDDIPSKGRIVRIGNSPLFIRADCNGDGAVDISDPVRILDYLFASGASLTCRDSCDANDDGATDVADAVSMLSGLFSTATPFPPPGSMCGPDPTADSIGCVGYGGCQ